MKPSGFEPAARDEQGWRQFLEGEKLLFGLLGAIFYAYPAREQMESLSAGSLLDRLPASDDPETAEGLRLLRTSASRADDEEAARIKVDYVRLFVGGGTRVLAPPWESVYVSPDPLLFQQATGDVSRWYRRLGLEASGEGKEPDDHAGLELEFLARLAGEAVAALDQGDDAGFDGMIEAQREFLQQHVLRWMPSWCDTVARLAETEFYRGAALLTRGLLEEAAAHLEAT